MTLLIAAPILAALFGFEMWVLSLAARSFDNATGTGLIEFQRD